jgi:hypothetical protein
MSDGGKGSGRRPGVGFSDGWERIFGGSVQLQAAPVLESAPTAPDLLSTRSEGSVRSGAVATHPPEGCGAPDATGSVFGVHRTHLDI